VDPADLTPGEQLGRATGPSNWAEQLGMAGIGRKNA
jgi:hypothetical protein